jgi:hypothetical protein
MAYSQKSKLSPDTCFCSCWQGETMTLNSGHQRANYSSPRWYISVESQGGIILTGENEITCKKSVLLPLCPTQILHESTRAYGVRGQWLTAWAMARPTQHINLVRSCQHIQEPPPCVCITHPAVGCTVRTAQSHERAYILVHIELPRFLLDLQ